jgi:hypothetical protein
VIVLQTSDLFVRLDPAHGGEILDLINPHTGAQYLGRPPFASLPPQAGELDEGTWTSSYRGGWQTVARMRATPAPSTAASTASTAPPPSRRGASVTSPEMR